MLLVELIEINSDVDSCTTAIDLPRKKPYYEFTT
jgi:hypothetical protein